MRLKPQPRPKARAASRPRRPARSQAGGRGPGRQARRPGLPLRRRLAGRIPRLGRVLAVLVAASLVAGLAGLLNGPWLRVAHVAWAGDHHTETDDLVGLLEAQRGASLLMVDTEALAEQIAGLPAVAEARVEARLPDRVEATVVERVPAFVWQTLRARLVGDGDGTLFAAYPLDGGLPADLAALPLIDDQRAAARVMRSGDVIPEGVVHVAMRLQAIDPVALGSSAARVAVRIDDRHGFTLLAGDVGWQIAFGLYGRDPSAQTDTAARIERQVTAVRTLFASEPEAGIGWVDARNPGKVYFRAKG